MRMLRMAVIDGDGAECDVGIGAACACTCEVKDCGGSGGLGWLNLVRMGGSCEFRESDESETCVRLRESSSRWYAMHCYAVQSIISQSSPLTRTQEVVRTGGAGTG